MTDDPLPLRERLRAAHEKQAEAELEAHRVALSFATFVACAGLMMVAAAIIPSVLP